MSLAIFKQVYNSFNCSWQNIISTSNIYRWKRMLMVLLLECYPNCRSIPSTVWYFSQWCNITLHSTLTFLLGLPNIKSVKYQSYWNYFLYWSSQCVCGHFSILSIRFCRYFGKQHSCDNPGFYLDKKVFHCYLIYIDNCYCLFLVERFNLFI